MIRKYADHSFKLMQIGTKPLQIQQVITYNLIATYMDFTYKKCLIFWHNPSFRIPN